MTRMTPSTQIVRDAFSINKPTKDPNICKRYRTHFDHVAYGRTILVVLNFTQDLYNFPRAFKALNIKLHDCYFNISTLYIEYIHPMTNFILIYINFLFLYN